MQTKTAIYGSGGRFLVLACKALGVEQLQLVPILKLTQRLGPNGKVLSPRRLTDLVGYLGSISKISAKKGLNEWRSECIEMPGEQS